MPICLPCQPEHTVNQCEDTVHTRTGTARRCCCQHQPRIAANTGQPSPGPECEIPTELRKTAPTFGNTGHTGASGLA